MNVSGVGSAVTTLNTCDCLGPTYLRLDNKTLVVLCAASNSLAYHTRVGSVYTCEPYSLPTYCRAPQQPYIDATHTIFIPCLNTNNFIMIARQRAYCDVGQYSSSGLLPCFNCAVGTYQTNIQQTSCRACVPGYQCSDAKSSPTACGVGYTSSCTQTAYSSCAITQCSKCASGSTTNTTTATSCVQCQGNIHSPTAVHLQWNVRLMSVTHHIYVTYASRQQRVRCKLLCLLFAA